MKERATRLFDTLAPLMQQSIHISSKITGVDSVPQGLQCDHVITDSPFVL